MSAFGFTISYVTIPMAYIVWYCGMYTTVFLSYQLYSLVCHQKIISRKRAFQVMGVISILSILINLPVFWFTNNWDMNCNYKLLLILNLIPTLVFGLIIPMVSLTVFSCLTIRKVNLFFKNKSGLAHLGQERPFKFQVAITGNADEICGTLIAIYVQPFSPYDAVICH